MERLIDHLIRNGLEESLLSKSQHAYWKGRSTETALHTIVRCLEDGINRKEYTLVAFLDIEGAFNNVKADAIISSLRRHNIDPGISTWIENMLLGRVVSSELVGSSITRQVKRGTPQGGVLSPLLWLLVVDEILVKLERKGVTVIAYADDIAILVTGKFLDTLSELIESALSFH